MYYSRLSETLKAVTYAWTGAYTSRRTVGFIANSRRKIKDYWAGEGGGGGNAKSFARCRGTLWQRKKRDIIANIIRVYIPSAFLPIFGRNDLIRRNKIVRARARISLVILGFRRVPSKRPRLSPRDYTSRLFGEQCNTRFTSAWRLLHSTGVWREHV